tara:strand:- start:1045 stop:1557 length:513 start_codon:yes stop_codon:yes gene_type:complete
MAHFAKLGINSKVIGVEVVADADCKNADNIEDETVGIQFLENIHGWPLWKKTSYNTSSGKHYTIDGSGQKVESADQSKAFRKNYAGIGHTYDEDRDAFIPPKPYASWVVNETTCIWEAPVAYPSVTTYGDPAKPYEISWDETNLRWICKDSEETPNNFKWDVSSSAWVAL